MCGLGYNQSDSSGNQDASSGFALLPASLQQAFTQYGTQLNNLYSGNQAQAFQLPSLNSGATNALNNLSNQAYAPNASNIASNMALQQNPWDSSVINQYNQQANGQQSNLNQQLSSAGQFGSNRAALGANDIDLTRLNNIGAFQQGEFNTQLNNALTTIPQAQNTSAQNAVNAGTTIQSQQYQNQQAPFTAMQSYGQALGVLPSSGGSVSTGSSSSDAEGGQA